MSTGTAKMTPDEKRLQKLEGELGELQAKVRNLKDKMQRSVEVPRARAMVGSTFKYRNCYSCPSSEADYWWLYIKIVGADDEGVLTLFSFQKDTRGRWKAETEERSLGTIAANHQPITLTEYNEALDGMLGELGKLGALPADLATLLRLG